MIMQKCETLFLYFTAYAVFNFIFYSLISPISTRPCLGLIRVLTDGQFSRFNPCGLSGFMTHSEQLLLTIYHPKIKFGSQYCILIVIYGFVLDLLPFCIFFKSKQLRFLRFVEDIRIRGSKKSYFGERLARYCKTGLFVKILCKYTLVFNSDLDSVRLSFLCLWKH